MGFRAEVREKLGEISDFMRVIAEQKVLHTAEIERLSAQNKDLMDRLMSRNFETLMTYQPRVEDGSSFPKYDPEADEQSAGEILDIEA